MGLDCRDESELDCGERHVAVWMVLSERGMDNAANLLCMVAEVHGKSVLSTITGDLVGVVRGKQHVKLDDTNIPGAGPPNAYSH